jgi:predicted transcriptional regulator
VRKMNEKIERSEKLKKGFDYFCKGLSSKEIALLLGVSYRTVQGYMNTEKWTERRDVWRERERKKIIRKYLKSIDNE